MCKTEAMSVSNVLFFFILFEFHPCQLLGYLRVVIHIILISAQPVGAQTSLGGDQIAALLDQHSPAALCKTKTKDSFLSSTFC